MGSGRVVTQAGQPVKNKTASDGDVEAGTSADPRYLDAVVGPIEPLRRKAVMLMAEKKDRAMPGWLDSRHWC